MSQANRFDLIIGFIKEYTRRNDGPPDAFRVIMAIASMNPSLSAASIQDDLDTLQEQKRLRRDSFGYFHIIQEESA